MKCPSITMNIKAFLNFFERVLNSIISKTVDSNAGKNQNILNPVSSFRNADVPIAHDVSADKGLN